MANQFSKKYTEQDYKEKCESLNLEYIGYHREKKKGTIIHFICPIHKDKGIQEKDWSHFRTYTYGCSYCSGRGKTTEEIQSIVKNKDVEIISEYKGNEKPISCKCRKCGNMWTTLPKTLITNGAGCPICGRRKANRSEMKSHEQFVKEISVVNPNIEIIGEYIGAHKKIKCKCKIDGTIWYGYPSNLLNRSAGCPTCNTSRGENKMIKTLEKIGIIYIRQHSFSDCVYISKLKFDAFDIINNIAFEYNGEQHYYPVDFAGKGSDWALEQFELTRKRDVAKINYCNKNNIPMIIIPYWEIDNMENYILNKLKELQLKIA